MAVVGKQNLLQAVQQALGAGRAGGRALTGGLNLTAKTGSFIVEIILVVVLGVLLGLIFLSFFAPLSLPENTRIAAAPAEQQAGAPVDVKSPFPKTELSAVAQPLTAAEVETTLDLTLTGVWAAQDGGSATIRLSDGDEKRFAVGDTIVSGVSLAAVYADRVTLNSNGVRETLRFESKRGAAAGEPQQRQQRPRRAPNVDLSSAAVGRLASVVRLAPSVDRNGNFAIEIHAARDLRTFAALGLENGDRLVSINGAAAPSDPAALGKLLGEMQRSDNARLVVDRGGEQKTIVFSTDKLGFD